MPLPTDRTATEPTMAATEKLRKDSTRAAKARMTEMAIGPTKSPMFPGSRKIGMKPRIVVKVEAARGVNRWATASLAAPVSLRGESGGRWVLAISATPHQPG
jgi:hypothetical protein